MCFFSNKGITLAAVNPWQYGSLIPLQRKLCISTQQYADKKFVFLIALVLYSLYFITYS